MIVTRALEKHLSSLIDYDFTSRMESSLDEVASGKLARLACLKGFYFGDRGLESLLSQAKSAWGVENEGYPVLMEGEELYISFNRYGEFIQKGEQRIYLNADIAPDEMNAAKLAELMNQHTDKPEPVYLLDCPTTIVQHIYSMVVLDGIFKWEMMRKNATTRMLDCCRKILYGMLVHLQS